MKAVGVFLCAVGATCAELADAPLPPPRRLTVCSANQAVCAESDPGSNTTTIRSHQTQRDSWTIPGWHRWLFVSNDARSVVVGYPGLNLVPRDAHLQQPVLWFYQRDRLVRTVTLGDLYQDMTQLVPTTSHLPWTHHVGINDANLLLV